MKQPSQGFTLLELLVVMLLIGIMATLATPSFLAFGERNARSAAVNQLQSTLAFARNTAITQRMDITVCPTDDARENCINEWSGPILVVAGDQQDGFTASDIVRFFPPAQRTGIEYSRNWRRIKFTPLGHSSGYNGRFWVCPSGAMEGRELVLSQLGRLRIAEQPYDCSAT
ncbi:GspH/FimT family pseudopilin [Vreelandella massiliensis]|uniref:GspH/FimT family pseudopilin n=1 Tax=Vreelandella massiliensis TaxID=1816686 RepID=UPI00096AA1F6|nr:GspH/FimT family pseudopilin [Halomonas massiliensis]